MMLILLPLAFFGLSFILLRKNDPDRDWRPAFLAASTATGVVLTVITESLSLFRQLNVAFVAVSWSLAVAGLAAWRWRDLLKKDSSPLVTLPRQAALSVADWVWTAAGGLIALAVGVVAFAAPPNTWDSMTFHMPRIMHWIQNGSLVFFPTPILRQLHQTPWTEYAILHLQLLSGGDGFANGVQWFALVGSGVGISLLAKQFGANVRGQVLAAVVAVTLPMGLMQGSSTQTDYAEAFWLVAVVSFLLRLMEEPRLRFALAAGGALGLAFLTKATAYLFGLPFLVWVGLALIRSRSWKAVRLLALIAVVALALNLGFFSRNYRLYGNPLGPGTEGVNSYTNAVISVPTMESNVIRNLALHIGTPFPEINSLLGRGIGFLHRIAGLSASDPRTTWVPYSFQVPPLSYYEDNAGNPLHLLLFFLSVVIFLFVWKENRVLWLFLAALTAGFLLFCLILKWQPWNSRLQLPLFVLQAAFTGSVLAKLPPRRVWISHLAMLALLIGAAPGVLNNPSRPLIGGGSIFLVSREQQYFTNMPALAAPYEGAAQYLAGTSCHSIGLILGPDDWEYPLWVFLQHDYPEQVRIEHVAVENISERIAENDPAYSTFQPCAVIMVNSEPPPVIVVSGMEFREVWRSQMVTVYRKSSDL